MSILILILKKYKNRKSVVHECTKKNSFLWFLCIFSIIHDDVWEMEDFFKKGKQIICLIGKWVSEKMEDNFSMQTE